ncbi:hypothetical protein [Thiothrix subterranea]|uniref:hypothetical protein n=1 Tax=Thiothrix subterranea TaxID=2735563 RepID=UPI00280A6BA0|nr:hypothetical protein [Thiothrix subterranea]
MFPSSISKKIVSYFPDWLDTRGEEFSAKASEDIKHFIKNDLLELAKIIEDKAASLQEELQQIASEYEKIIQKTVTITDSSEMVLSARLKNKEALRKEIVEKKAEQERLKSLVEDLQDSVSKFDAEAKALASRADTLETRSFIMSLVKMGTDMVAASLPAVAAGITTAMTGGVGLSRVRSFVEPKPSPATNDEETAKDEAAEDIKRKTDISDKNKSAELVKKEIEDLEDSIDKLNQEKTSLLEKKTRNPVKTLNPLQMIPQKWQKKWQNLINASKRQKRRRQKNSKI